MKGGLCYYSHVTFYMYHYTFGGLGASGPIRATRMGTDQPADFAARMATEYKFRCIKITAPSAKTACRAKARCRPVLLSGCAGRPNGLSGLIYVRRSNGKEEFWKCEQAKTACAALLHWFVR